MNRLTKFFTSIIILLPILNVYGSFIPSIELGTLIIIVLSIIFLINGRLSAFGKDYVWLLVLGVFFLCTIISTQLLTLNPNYTLEYFFRFLKICVIVVVIFSIGKKYYNHEYALAFLTKSSYICTVFLIIQNALFFIGIDLPGIIPGFAAVKGDASADIVPEDMFRPCAFFIEPSHYAAYQLVFLCYLVSNPQIKNRKKLFPMTLFGIFLSTSGTGYTTTLAIFILSIFICPEFRRELTSKGFFRIIMLVASFIILLVFTPIGMQSISRFLNDDGTVGGAATGRLDSGAFLIFLTLQGALQWIGCGFGYRPDDIYFPSLYAILYGDGIIGLIVFLLLLIYYYKKSSSFGKLLCMTYAILFVGTGVFNFASIGLYFSLISHETKSLSKKR